MNTPLLLPILNFSQESSWNASPPLIKMFALKFLAIVAGDCFLNCSTDAVDNIRNGKPSVNDVWD
jgi:hypothetical protein